MTAAPTLAASAGFVAHDPAFADVAGDEPRLELVARTDAHEGRRHQKEMVRIKADYDPTTREARAAWRPAQGLAEAA